MTLLPPQTAISLQQGFRYFNKFMLLLWRLGLGRMLNLWPEGTGRIMVLTHTGRRSGQRRQNPVNYAILNGDIYCTAGFGAKSDWYRNVRANPEVEVWLLDSWYKGIAEDVTGCPGSTTIMRQVLIASGFAARAEGINPQTLIRIHLTDARTGPGGPGDLAWVWPVATFLLLMFRPRRRRR
jgi:deazaflavin-dependent oxidoreductase (nitroreductase family)